MGYTRPMTKITILKGDITIQEVDAIVSAANSSLQGGGGVDGAIHYGAGPGLLEECVLHGGCDTGEAKITKGYDLPSKHVIHTVGPRYGDEEGREEELLRNCYKNSLLLAKEYGLKTIAFPAISTGVYSFPRDRASKIAFITVQTFIEQYPDHFEEIRFVLFDDINHAMYSAIAERGINTDLNTINKLF